MTYCSPSVLVAFEKAVQDAKTVRRDLVTNFSDNPRKKLSYSHIYILKDEFLDVDPL